MLRMASHVLLIEDEPHIAEAIRFILSRDGWQVSTLSDGAEAVAAVQAKRPDLVILDLMLPGCSGLEILTALRADPATADLPVMMLTAKGQGRDREAAERAGVSRFMTKPFANADMLASVRALIEK
jgi:DNA-binding response OmpR family regulator